MTVPSIIGIIQICQHPLIRTAAGPKTANVLNYLMGFKGKGIESPFELGKIE